MTETAVRERPIIFSGDMVCAILEGRKCQTRRVVKNELVQLVDRTGHTGSFNADRSEIVIESWSIPVTNPYGVPGDRLWVREAFFDYDSGMPPDSIPIDARIEYRATPWTHEFADSEDCGPWKPSIHMPRWASRINLEVLNIRVDRLQDISEEDARAEGFSSEGREGSLNGVPATVHYLDPVVWYAHLWDGINGKRGYGWASNPWVWVIEFKMVQP